MPLDADEILEFVEDLAGKVGVEGDFRVVDESGNLGGYWVVPQYLTVNIELKIRYHDDFIPLFKDEDDFHDWRDNRGGKQFTAAVLLARENEMKAGMLNNDNRTDLSPAFDKLEGLMRWWQYLASMYIQPQASEIVYGSLRWGNDAICAEISDVVQRLYDYYVSTGKMIAGFKAGVVEGTGGDNFACYYAGLAPIDNPTGHIPDMIMKLESIALGFGFHNDSGYFDNKAIMKIHEKYGVSIPGRWPPIVEADNEQKLLDYWTWVADAVIPLQSAEIVYGVGKSKIPKKLYHATGIDTWRKIQEWGLRSMMECDPDKLYKNCDPAIHFVGNIQEAEEYGFNHFGEYVVLEINTKDVIKHGGLKYLGEWSETEYTTNPDKICSIPTRLGKSILDPSRLM